MEKINKWYRIPTRMRVPTRMKGLLQNIVHDFRVDFLENNYCPFAFQLKFLGPLVKW